jgi:hypothetical protein
MPSASIRHQLSKIFLGRTQRRKGRREGKNSASHGTASRSREAPQFFQLRVLCASASSPKKSCLLSIEREGPEIRGLVRSRCGHAAGIDPGHDEIIFRRVEFIMIRDFSGMHCARADTSAITVGHDYERRACH